jgi:asparagine synthetase B (glutamine-hydrolysing)
MFLLSRKIKAMGVKMVLSGEGSDEIFGGYLYFHNAPSAAALHEETVRRVKNLHLADCLRANKSTSAWGLEARVPFLDKQFLDLAMNIDPQEKMFVPGERIEKYILRKAFDTEGEPGAKPYLPKNILWRQKGESIPRMNRRENEVMLTLHAAQNNSPTELVSPPLSASHSPKTHTNIPYRLRLDRRPPRRSQKNGHRRANGLHRQRQTALDGKHPHHERGLLVPLDVRRALSPAVPGDRRGLGARVVGYHGSQWTVD